MRRLLCAFLAFIFVLGIGASADAGKLRLRLHPAYLPHGFLVTPEYSPVFAAGTIPNSATFIEGIWFRCASGTTTVTPDRYQSCNNVDFGNFLDAAGNAEVQPGLIVVFNDSNGSGGLMRINVNNATGGNNNSAGATISGINALATGWHYLLIYGDVSCSSAANTRCGGALLDAVQVVSGFSDVGSGGWTGTKTVAFASNPFYLNIFNGTQAAGKFEMAQFFLDLPTASPVSPGTNTPSFNTAKFISSSGQPVYFGSNCSIPLGHVPTICMINGAGAPNLVNFGSLGVNPTAGQQLTNTVTKQAYAAAFSPGETPAFPFARWTNSATFNGQCAESTLTCSSTSQPLASGVGNAIPTGDLLCVTITATSSTNATYNDQFQPPTGGGVATWTNILGTNVTAVNNANNNMAEFCGTVTTPTAAGANMPTLTWTWLSAGGGGFAGSAITLTSYGKTGGTPNVAAVVSTDSTVSATTLPCQISTGPVAPSGNSLWVCEHTAFSWAFASPTTTIGPPSTSNLLGKLPGATGGGTPLMEWERISSSGAVTRTAQGNPGNKSLAISKVLN